jgi:hypothetical protein
MEARLKLTSKIRADKRTKVATDAALNFEVFSMSQGLDEHFNIHQRLNNVFTTPVFESYTKTLSRRLKNFTSEDASALLKLVLSVLVVPVTQNPAMTAKFFENDNALLKRLFSPYLSAASVTATVIGYRDREYHVIEEMRQEIELTTGEHPLYTRQDFMNNDAYEAWKSARLVSLNHKMKLLEKQPAFSGRLTVTVLRAQGLNENKDRGESCSVYFIVKVADKEMRSEQYIANSWDPVFAQEPFSFDVSSRDCRIKIELWDKNFIGSTFLGCIMTKPRDLMWVDQPLERWWPLGSRTRTKDTGITGQLSVRFNFSSLIGPHRSPSANQPSKSTFSSFFSSSSSSSSATSSPHQKGGNTISTVTQSDGDVFGLSGRSSPSAGGLQNSLTLSSDSDVLPAPPPIVNSHLNNYPEWYSSLLMISLQDAFNNPPPKTSNSTPDDATSSESEPLLGTSPVSITPAAAFIPNPGIHTPMMQTPSRPSPVSSSILGPTPDRNREKRSSREYQYVGDLSSAFAAAATPSFEVGEKGETSNLLAPVPSHHFGSSSAHAPVFGYAQSTRSFTPLMLSESPREGNMTRSTSDLLTSSSGSLSRSAPSIRNATPIKRAVQLLRTGVTSSMSSVEEEAEDPVKYTEEVQWLLERFVERFSIDPCLSPLLNLEILDASFNTRSSIHMDALYASLVELESARAISPLYWIRVQQLYEYVVCETLKNHLDEALCHYFYRFPKNEPRGALSQTILLYSMITKSDIQQLSIILQDKLETAMMRMYKVVVGDKITESSLLDATRFVMQAVEQDLRYFNDVFPADLMLGSLSMRTYYLELLAKNIKAWLRTSPPISDLTMVLYSYLNRLHSQLSRAQCGFDLLPLASLFQPFVGKWIDHVGDNLPHWCRYDLLRREAWKSVSSQSSSHSSSSILHSISVQILFDAFNRVYSQYRQFDMRAAKDLKALVKIFIQTISAYMQVMAAQAVEVFAIQGAPKGVLVGGGRNSPSLRHAASSRFRTGSAGDVYALASSVSDSINPSSYSNGNLSNSSSSAFAMPSLSQSSSTSGSPSKFSTSSLSFWSAFGINPSSNSGGTAGSSSSSGSRSGSGHSSKTSSDRNLFQVPIESCVWISTLETLSQKLYDFCKQMVSDGEKGAEEARAWFSDTFSQIQQLQAQLFQLIIKLINTNPSLELALDTLLSHSTDVDKVTDADAMMRLEQLFDYINSRVEVLSAHLDYKVFLRLLEQIWLVIVKDVEVLTFPAVGDRKADAKKAHFVEFALPFIINFFEGKDGDGLPRQFLEGEAAILRSCFAMLKVPTGVLCKAYTDILNGLSPSGITGGESIDLLILEQRLISVLSMRKNDKEAKKFVKANKLSTMNRSTLRAFDLPKGETVVDYFTCRKGKDQNISGYLYITTNWICFDTYLWGDHMTTIPLSEIRSIKRKKTTLSTNGLTIRLKDGSSAIHFSALNKIKAYDIIVEQAQKLGYVFETYDKHAGGSSGSPTANASSSSGSSSLASSSRDIPVSISSSIRQSSPVRKSSSQGHHKGDKERAKDIWPDEFFRDALDVDGAKPIENEDDMRSHFGLVKNDDAIVAFDCSLTIESKESSRAPSVGAPTPSQVGILYCFTRSACFRCSTHKIVLYWSQVTHLGQRGTDGILIVVKEKKKSKQYCFAKFKAPDDVFALLHSIWGKARA